jgi:hypothetical protein
VRHLPLLQHIRADNDQKQRMCLLSQTNRRYMTKKEYTDNICLAESFRTASDDPAESSFWAGYLKGLSVYYHGETKSTGWSHADWMMAIESPDKFTRLQGRGYRSGYEGAPFIQAIKVLTISDQGRKGGSVRSKKKAKSSAKNGLQGGRPKRRKLC